jgi:hypothetical protein
LDVLELGSLRNAGNEIETSWTPDICSGEVLNFHLGSTDDDYSAGLHIEEPL